MDFLALELSRPKGRVGAKLQASTSTVAPAAAAPVEPAVEPSAEPAAEPASEAVVSEYALLGSSKLPAPSKLQHLAI